MPPFHLPQNKCYGVFKYEKLNYSHRITPKKKLVQEEKVVRAPTRTMSVNLFGLNRVSDVEFRKLVRSLNPEQKEIFYHILKMAKTSNAQQFVFLCGGAGAGKTRLTTTLYQALIRHFNTLGQVSHTYGDQLNIDQSSCISSNHPSKVGRERLNRPVFWRQLPTGKAAYLIKGQIIHSACNISCKSNPV